MIATRTQHVLGPLAVLAAPTGQVVTRKEVKDTARIVSLKDDGLIDRAIRIGTEYCEQMISGHRQFLTAKYCVPVSGWWSGQLRMPRPPLQSVDGIYYYDSDGVQQTVDPDTYIVTTPWRSQGTIELAPNQYWPTAQYSRTYPIEIHITCGYGTAAEVPEKIKYAVVVAASQIYYGRRTVNQETVDTLEQFLESTEGYGSYG